jgi:hypothetical protein
VRSFFRKRWQVSGLTTPVAYRTPDVHAWLDSLDALARAQRATVATWVPSE